MNKFFKDVKKYYKYSVYSAKAELKKEVAGSYLNWIWWILEPLFLMLIYAFMFGFVFGAKEEYFTAFIFVGLTLWTFFNQNMKNSVRIVKKNKSIISKVYLPKFVLIETRMLVNWFKMSFSFCIVLVLMVYYKIPLTINVLYIIPILVCLLIINFGFMTILMHFGVYVEDLANVVEIGLRLVFYLTGIMYSIENRIGKFNMGLAILLEKVNPMAFLIKSARSCLLYGESPDLKLMFSWSIVGLLISVIGLRTIYKFENSYVKVI